MEWRLLIFVHRKLWPSRRDPDEERDQCTGEHCMTLTLTLTLTLILTLTLNLTDPDEERAVAHGEKVVWAMSGGSALRQADRQVKRHY
jgi:hypothetical protein